MGLPVAWANGSGGGTPISAANLLNLNPADPVTTMPGSPVNKQIVTLVDSTTAPTYSWRFQYSTTVSDSNKWVFIGGSPAEAEVATSENVASATYVDAATAGPSITVPRAGVYLISFGAFVIVDVNVVAQRYVSPKIGGAATSDTDAALLTILAGATNQFVGTILTRTIRKTLAASDVIKLQYRGNNAGSQAVANRWLSILPVRVA